MRCIRLVYNWVMLDQELSLFHDTAPLLSITELQCPLPGPEVLWMSPSSERWLAAVQSVYGCTANVNPQLLSAPSLTPSLYDLFQDFLHDNLSRRQGASRRSRCGCSCIHCSRFCAISGRCSPASPTSSAPGGRPGAL